VKKVIVTGGLGYIGSHTIVKLVEAGYEPVIIDNLSNSKLSSYSKVCEIIKSHPPIYKLDLSTESGIADLEEIFKENAGDIHSVIHFAGFKSVKESILSPDKYYKNNLFSTINLLNVMKKFGIEKIVFSSSATVYGDSDSFPVSEESPRKEPTNPYGRTKYICEDIIKSYCDFGNLSPVVLRYFNPIGAHPSGKIFEDPNGTPENLVPYIKGVLDGKYSELVVFGSDYDTKDGTCIRDYIDVNDLAQAHINALDACELNKYKVYNIGSGNGYSVLDLIRAFEDQGVKIKYKIGDRRPGDVAEVYADIEKAKIELEWKPTTSLSDSIKSIIRINNS
jgi:UDP-glucose 4-epimerase